MNKWFINLLCLLLSSISISQNFSGGVFGGLSTSQVSGDGLSGFNKIGPRLGLYVNRHVKWYGIQLELQYLTKGSKKNNSKSNQNTNIDDINVNYINDYNFHLNYIGVPVLWFSNIRENLTLELGTSFNFLIKQREEIEFHIDNSREVHKFEASILIGFTYKINEKIALNTRLSNSIKPIRPHASGETYQLNKGQYNTALCFNIYYVLKS